MEGDTGTAGPSPGEEERVQQELARELLAVRQQIAEFRTRLGQQGDVTGAPTPPVRAPDRPEAGADDTDAPRQREAEGARQLEQSLASASINRALGEQALAVGIRAEEVQAAVQAAVRGLLGARAKAEVHAVRRELHEVRQQQAEYRTRLQKQGTLGLGRLDASPSRADAAVERRAKLGALKQREAAKVQQLQECAAASDWAGGVGGLGEHSDHQPWADESIDNANIEVRDRAIVPNTQYPIANTCSTKYVTGFLAGVTAQARQVERAMAHSVNRALARQAQSRGISAGELQAAVQVRLPQLASWPLPGLAPPCLAS